jgi:hypothetical protein
MLGIGQAIDALGRNLRATNPGSNPGGSGGAGSGQTQPNQQPPRNDIGPPQIDLNSARKKIMEARDPRQWTEASIMYSMQLRQHAFLEAMNMFNRTGDPSAFRLMSHFLQEEARRAEKENNPYVRATALQLMQQFNHLERVTSAQMAWQNAYQRAYAGQRQQNRPHSPQGGRSGLSLAEQERRQAIPGYVREYREAVNRYHRESLEAPYEYQRRSAQERLDFLLENSRAARLVFMQRRYEPAFERREAQLRQELREAYEKYKQAEREVASVGISKATEEQINKLKAAEREIQLLQIQFHRLQDERNRYRGLYQRELERAGVTAEQVAKSEKQMIDLGIIRKREEIKLDDVTQWFSDDALNLRFD